MERIQFRTASVFDLPSVLEIRLSVQENRLDRPERVTWRLFDSLMGLIYRRRELDLRGWVCEVNGKVVGFCFAEKGRSSILGLFVRPGHEGKGIGKGLLKQAVDWLFGLGARKVRLSTRANTRAERLYQALGWRRTRIKSAAEVWYCLRRSPAFSNTPAP